MQDEVESQAAVSVRMHVRKWRLGTLDSFLNSLLLVTHAFSIPCLDIWSIPLMKLYS